MRPQLLNPLFTSVTSLKGIGGKLEKILARLLRPSVLEQSADVRIIDLLLHLPSAIIDRRNRPTITALPHDGVVTVEVIIGRHKKPPPHNKRVPYRVECFDDSGSLSCVFFHVHGNYVERLMPPGETRFISGRVEWYNGLPQIVHPDHVLTRDEFDKMPLLEPVYPLTAGLSGKVLAKSMQSALAMIPDLPEWQNRRDDWPDFTTALRQLHQPQTSESLEPLFPARARLAYDELLSNQLALGLVRRHMKASTGRAINGTGELRAKILGALPFELTGSQKTAIAEILQDMASTERMLRLLQGDVGAGKTIVAMMMMLTAVEAGAQAAIMAPTEILARQHFASMHQMCDNIGVSVALLTGRDKGKSREALLQSLRDGETDILVGTHALFQSDVEFKDLAAVVIDEQHRFGVHQRLALQSKAMDAPDVLVMTATPIPRTLTLTHYGDMDVSRLTEKPAGRHPIATRVMPVEKMADIFVGLKRVIDSGARIYWVCPLVEDSEGSDLATAENRYNVLKQIFGTKVGLVHGRMKGPEKDEVMAQFKQGEISVLVATTVIEVGVDVPEATVMVIENAEQFGLAQLHQLRGRVGRGGHKSSCILLYQSPLGETARSRLKIMRNTEDGFIIAEEDLRLRGTGELLGTRQSGIVNFRLALPFEHADLLAEARADTEQILADDPLLQSQRGKALKHLLYLFERDAAVRLLSSG